MGNFSDNKNQYRLSIRFSSDGFSLYTYDVSNNLISTKEIFCSLFKSTAQEISNLLTNETETLIEFSSTELICELPIYTTLPLAFFKTENASDFLQFQFTKEKLDLTEFNIIRSWDLATVFSMPKSLKNALDLNFENITITHHISHFLANDILRNKKNSLQIRIRANAFDTVVLVNGIVQLVNSFMYNTNEDICYHVLNIFEKLSLSHDTCEILLFNSKNKQQLKTLLNKYIKHCTIAN